jgi:hypothetical protein
MACQPAARLIFAWQKKLHNKHERPPPPTPPHPTPPHPTHPPLSPSVAYWSPFPLHSGRQPSLLPPLLHCLQANCDPSRHRASVVDYRWAAPELPPQLDQPPPDLVTAADLVYDPGTYDDLVAALVAVAAPHTLVYMAIKCRGE